jgi:hypothetical protein
MRRFGFGFPMLGAGMAVLVVILVLTILCTTLVIRGGVSIPIPGWFYGGRDRMELENEYARDKAELQREIDRVQTDLDLLNLELQFDVVEAEVQLTILELRNQIEELEISHAARVSDIQQKAKIWSLAQPVLWFLGILGLFLFVRSVSTYFMRRASTTYADKGGVFPVLTIRRGWKAVGYYDPNRGVAAFTGIHKGEPVFHLPPGQDAATNQGALIQLGRALASGESNVTPRGVSGLLGRRRMVGQGLPEPRQSELDPAHVDLLLEEAGQLDDEYG